MSKNDSLGDRMKRYEGVAQNRLIGRTPAILRLDGKAFHTFTRGLQKPFDESLGDAMARTAEFLMANIQGAVMAYTQSDEISILVQDFARLETDAWYDNNVQKMVSVSASFATGAFNSYFRHTTKDKTAFFDARVFNVPKEEVANYFIWRQQDAVRNSVQMLAQSLFSHKELQGLNNSKLQDKMMLEKNINWNDIPTRFKRGICVWPKPDTTPGTGFTEEEFVEIDLEIPTFTTPEGRIAIERLFSPEYLRGEVAEEA